MWTRNLLIFLDSMCDVQLNQMALKWVDDGSTGSIMAFDRLLHKQEA